MHYDCQLSMRREAMLITIIDIKYFKMKKLQATEILLSKGYVGTSDITNDDIITKCIRGISSLLDFPSKEVDFEMLS